ncbi:tetratricopeptide repeat protein [Treponema primitia]|uniref:tetratricopeptide repeat protein n=1 Tax=Treponema primitia TaxID=88058 RepID=UPI003980AE0C
MGLGKIPRFMLIGVFMLAAFGVLGAQQKFALVIGNGTYTTVGRLNNPVNDASDMKAALEGLGFQVELVLNGNLGAMEDAVIRLGRRLSGAKDAYGFFFYAGHGVQSNGDNFLIPVDADIRSESLLRTKALVVQAVLNELEQAENALNVVVLDACRDNPFSWKARGGGRGLTVVGAQPAESIVVYATSAGSTASDDGGGRNGLFTTHLLNNLKTPGLEVMELFTRVGRDVSRASSNAQRPAVYTQFFNTAYLGSVPATPRPTPTPTPAPATGDAKASYDRGVAANGRKDYDTAIREFTEAIRINPNYADAYFLRGFAYGSKGDNDRAIADYTEAIRLNPNYTNAYYNRSLAYGAKGDNDRAIADYTEAIRLNPNHANAYYGRGLVYYNKHEYDRAIADYTEAIRLDPNYTDAYYNRGLAYQDGKRDYDRAIADYTETIRIDPNYAAAYINRGNAYRAKGDNDRAIADYTEAIRINPNYTRAYTNRGNAYKAKGDQARADADFAAAKRLGN